MARRRKHLTKAQKERLKQVGKWASVVALTWEAFHAVVLLRQKKRDVFNLALQKQNATKKPLLVVGNPTGDVLSRIFGGDYDCADLCIDARGCSTCENVLAMSVDEGLQTLAAGSYVVYVSPGQLENVPDAHATLTELQRVSGGDLFLTHYNPWTLRSLVAKRRVLAAPPTTRYTEWRDLPWLPGPSKVERLGRLLLRGGRAA